MKPAAQWRENMRTFYDERGYIVTETELRKEFEETETEARTFEEYVKNCTSKNGTLEEVKYERK